MLKSEKVVLRPVKESDLSLFVQWFNDQEVVRFLSTHLPITEMAEKKWIEELSIKRQNSDAIFVIEANFWRHRWKAIGTVGLHNINHKDQNAQFGIAIGDKNYWGRGCGTKAAELIIEYGFNQLNLRRISSSALAFNGRSLKMHKNLGFKEEGRRRQAVYKDGQFHDLVVLGLLRGEWKKQTNNE